MAWQMNVHGKVCLPTEGGRAEGALVVRDPLCCQVNKEDGIKNGMHFIYLASVVRSKARHLFRGCFTKDCEMKHLAHKKAKIRWLYSRWRFQLDSTRFGELGRTAIGPTIVLDDRKETSS